MKCVCDFQNAQGKLIGRRLISLQVRAAGAISRDNCAARLQHQVQYLHSATICTVEMAPQRACVGDSGSPLYNMQGQIVGIQAWRNDCNGRYPAVFTDIYRQLGFINDVIRN